MLIGDPKQAIYSFRGADIHAYIDAKRSTSEHYALGTNFRSVGPLVSAINRLFETQPDGDPGWERDTLNRLAFAALHGVTANAEKIRLRRRSDGTVTVSASYREGTLPSPGAEIATPAPSVVK